MINVSSRTLNELFDLSFSDSINIISSFLSENPGNLWKDDDYEQRINEFIIKEANTESYT